MLAGRIWLFDKIQKIFLYFGAFIRPASKNNLDFILEFIKQKNCGLDLMMIGDGTDGTYILPNDLEGINFCFSPGVGPTAMFEETIYDKFRIKSHLIDATIDKVPSARTDFYTFERKNLGAVTYDNQIDLDTWVKKNIENGSEEDLILQMDIEGAEFSSILSCDQETLRKFRIIAIEIHFLDFLKIKFLSNLVSDFFKKLEKYHVVCFSRANDCCGEIKFGKFNIPRVLELTLIRKDRCKENTDKPIQNFEIKNV